MSDHAYAVLARLARLSMGRDRSELLSSALRETSALVGADVLVMRAPDGSSDCIESRWPANAAWPSAGQIARWHRKVARTIKPVHIRTGGGGRKATGRHGIVLPVFATTGEVGVLVAAANAGPPFTQAQCDTLALLAQSTLAWVEAGRLREQTEAQTSVEVHHRLAREIHDGPLQMLTGVLLHLRLAGRDANPDTRSELAKLDGELRQTVAQMRVLIRRLRVAHPEAPLEERLRGALARLQRARGVFWALRWSEPRGLLAAEAADEIFHVINEALANVYRHSQARHVSIIGRPRGETFEVVVRDDGVGFDVAEALRRDLRSLSFGLVSMRERMNALGGALTVRSQAGGGTRVALSVPLRQRLAGKSA